MILAVPKDLLRGEAEAYAVELMVFIKAGRTAEEVTRFVMGLQRDRFCQPVDLARSQHFANKALALVRHIA